MPLRVEDVVVVHQYLEAVGVAARRLRKPNRALRSKRPVDLLESDLGPPEETNVLLNPGHPRAREVRVAGARAFVYDPRLPGER